MEPDFWHERWEQGQTAFDQQDAHRWLDVHWDRIGVADEAVVFVPLCGRSVDMVWLAERGHRVLGVELSPIAVKGFFDAVGVEAEVEDVGSLRVHRAGPYELWCGDLFEMPSDAFAEVGATYDRASLVALPPELRARYAAHLAELLPVGAPSFLISFEYDQNEMGGPPFSVPRTEIADRFGGAFEIEEIEAVSVIDKAAPMRERGLTELLETLSILRR